MGAWTGGGSGAPQAGTGLGWKYGRGSMQSPHHIL